MGALFARLSHLYRGPSTAAFKALSNCPDDDVAIEAATRFVDGHDVELCQLYRKVAVFDHQTKSLKSTVRTPSLCAGGRALKPTRDRQELLRRLEQTRRIVSQTNDRQTVENLNKLIADIEEDLRKPTVRTTFLKSELSIPPRVAVYGLGERQAARLT